MRMGPSVRWLVVSSFVAAWFVGAGAASAADVDPASYVGPKLCGMCHKKEETGNQYGAWQSSVHAKAYEVLGTPEAKEAGAKVGVDNPQESGKCLQCHSTAYNWTEEPQTTKIKPEEGVTCESCHGAGKGYMKKATMEDRDAAIAAGLVHPATQNCTKCHNEQSPTWNPERYTKADGTKVGFDVEQAYEKIKHPNPQKQE